MEGTREKEEGFAVSAPKESLTQPSVVASVCDGSSQEAEAGGSHIGTHPGIERALSDYGWVCG